MKKLLLTLVLALLVAPNASAATEHCPVGGTKTESGRLGNIVVLPVGTLFCVKASNEATGQVVADGTTTLIEYVEQAGIINEQGVPHAVSYYVIYETNSDGGDGDDGGSNGGSSSSGSPTGTSGGASTGGTTGGTTIQTPQTLPFTGFSVLIPLSLALVLLATGYLLVRKPDETQ